mgnify:CR=1 FL=1
MKEWEKESRMKTDELNMHEIIMGWLAILFMAIIPIGLIVWIIIQPISFEFVMLRLIGAYVSSFGCLGWILSRGKEED